MTLKIFVPDNSTTDVKPTPIGQVTTDIAEYVWMSDGTWQCQAEPQMAKYITSLTSAMKINNALAGAYEAVLAKVADIFQPEVHPKWQLFLTNDMPPDTIF